MIWDSKIQKPENAPIALLLIDVINHFEFPDGDRVFRQALKIAKNIAKFKKRARLLGIPTIYVNDNFGDWRSERSALLSYCLRSDAKASRFVQTLKPDREDYFILKPMHSAFYQTPLDTLLQHLGTHAIILVGLTSNSCLTCTANDANMRQFALIVPSDCSASRTAAEHRHAIEYMKQMLHARTDSSDRLSLRQLLKMHASKPLVG